MGIALGWGPRGRWPYRHRGASRVSRGVAAVSTSDAEPTGFTSLGFESLRLRSVLIHNSAEESAQSPAVEEVGHFRLSAKMLGRIRLLPRGAPVDTFSRSGGDLVER